MLSGCWVFWYVEFDSGMVYPARSPRTLMAVGVENSTGEDPSNLDLAGLEGPVLPGFYEYLSSQ